MTEFDAVYFDGHTSARKAVRVCADAGQLHIAGEGIDFKVPLDEVSVDAPVADTPRALALPGGAQLRTRDHAAVNALYPRANLFQAWVRQFERHSGMAMASVVIVALAAWWFAVSGIPLAANLAAKAIPPQIEAKIGVQTLAALDASFCAPSTLDAARKAPVTAMLDRLAGSDTASYRLAFRACPRIGPNAFALPGGTIIVIDELVELAANDREIGAILAHEIGHVEKRHALRMALQSAGVAALISALAGDAVSITNIVVALPTILMQSGYSREFETEADDFAFARLKTAGLSPLDFADIMTRLSDHQKKRLGEPESNEKSARVLDYLSMHPDTAQRIERARNFH